MRNRVFADPRNVQARAKRGMVMVIEEAIKQAENGDNEMFKSALKNIHNTPNYSVKTILEKDVIFDGVHYFKGDKVTQFYEGCMCFMAVYKDRRDGRIAMFVDPNSLLTQNQMEDKYGEEWKRSYELKQAHYGDVKPETKVFGGISY